MEFSDKQIPCADCRQMFTFTAGEQRWFKEHGFDNPPRRCANCRKSRKDRDGAGSRGSGSRSGRGRPKHRITCAQCGVEAEVPFEPRAGTPVYCSGCYQTQRQRG